VVTPLGALAPLARDLRTDANGSDEISLRYGRWRYDPDDAVHDNIGVSWSHSLGFAKLRLTLTGAYELVECPTCDGWTSGGIDLESAVWDRDIARGAGRPIHTAIGVRLSIGGAKYLGAEGSTAGSAALTIPLDVALPILRTSSLSATIVPGLGFGHITGADFAAGGLLPMIGAAISLAATSRLNLNVGAQQIILIGSPVQVGAAISWKLGAAPRPAP
jgi:hypothetical protein